MNQAAQDVATSYPRWREVGHRGHGGGACVRWLQVPGPVRAVLTGKSPGINGRTAVDPGLVRSSGLVRGGMELRGLGVMVMGWPRHGLDPPDVVLDPPVTAGGDAGDVMDPISRAYRLLCPRQQPRRWRSRWRMRRARYVQFWLTLPARFAA